MIYLTLFLEFFKIGLFCFGGAFGMIPLIEETVLSYGWLTESEFFSFIGVCESTPGPIAVNVATYVGSVQGGLLGSICASVGVVLPSFLIILLIASVLKNLTEHRLFKGFIRGVQPVIAALILSTGILLMMTNFGFGGLGSFRPDWISILTFALLTLVFLFAKHVLGKKLTAIPIILLSAVLGIALSLIADWIGAV